MEVNPLVFETSASTNSAIRAGVVFTGRKDNTKLFSKQIICKKLKWYASFFARLSAAFRVAVREVKY